MNKPPHHADPAPLADPSGHTILDHPAWHHDPEPKSFWTRYIFARDHKIIALQFLFSSLFWMVIGGLLALAVRWQLAWPGTKMPILGPALFRTEGGVITPDCYNMLFTMHGTIMIFLVIIPMLLGAFANFLIPLQIGFKDMAFPTLNMISYWVMWPAFFAITASFFVAGGAAGNGWTSYPPLAGLASLDHYTHGGLSAQGSDLGQTLWLIGVTFAGTSSMMGSVNYMTTIINCRAPGMTMMRLPLTIWALLITSILQAFAVPVLASASLLLIADRELGTSFFEPTGLYVNGIMRSGGGGSPLLWQHLFWFYSHPAVYIMILPAMGMVSEILATFSRKPVFGYRPMVYSIATIAGLGFVVWGHHMFQSGMNPIAGTGFMLTTMFIALPSAVKVFNWLATMWGGRLQITTPMLHAIGFVSLFIMGGLSGIFMAATPVDRYIHDTYFIVAHFHYILAGSSLFGIFAGITYWYPKMFGRMMNEFWGKVHFILSFLFMNATFLMMHQLGLAGMPRRVSDPYFYQFLEHLQPLNQFITIAAIGMAASQLILVANFFGSLFWGPKAPLNPWGANTLEWSVPSPPPHGNFAAMPLVFRGPHEFSDPAYAGDFAPQWLPRRELEAAHPLPTAAGTDSGGQLP